MKYLSVASGIEAASVAWQPIGWQPVAFAEIDNFPAAVLAHHYPDVPNLGDMTKFRDWPDAAIDLLVGGTSCQSFSFAGLRQGLADPRGKLMLTYLAILERYRPEWLVWENVPGVLSSSEGRDFGAFIEELAELGYHAAWRVLDAQYVRVDGFGRAVPQRRRRVFVVGHLGDWRCAAAVLFECESLSWDSPPRRRERIAADVAPCIGASGRGFEQTGETRGRDAVIAFGGNKTSGSIDVATTCQANGSPHGRLNFASETFLAFDMRGRDDGSQFEGPHETANIRAASGGSSKSYIAQSWAVRRLTPVECERLQGFPDDYTNIPYRGKPAADGPRYKALGNSMAVNVMRWIGRRIELVESITRE